MSLTLIWKRHEKITIVFGGVFRTQSKIYDRAFLGK